MIPVGEYHPALFDKLITRNNQLVLAICNYDGSINNTFSIKTCRFGLPQNLGSLTNWAFSIYLIMLDRLLAGACFCCEGIYYDIYYYYVGLLLIIIIIQ